LPFIKIAWIQFQIPPLFLKQLLKSLLKGNSSYVLYTKVCTTIRFYVKGYFVSEILTIQQITL